jgi:hypothetical protein
LVNFNTQKLAREFEEAFDLVVRYIETADLRGVQEGTRKAKRAQRKQANAENQQSCLTIVRVWTHQEISQTRKTRGLKSESFGPETAKNRETQAINMVDRAGFGPATFRILGWRFLQTGRSSAPSMGIPG